MTLIQKLITSLVPRSWAQDMEADSQAWKMRCPNCNYAVSIWEMGGIRWKAIGNPRRLWRCRHCGQISWHIIKRD